MRRNYSFSVAIEFQADTPGEAYYQLLRVLSNAPSVTTFESTEQSFLELTPLTGVELARAMGEGFCLYDEGGHTRLQTESNPAVKEPRDGRQLP